MGHSERKLEVYEQLARVAKAMANGKRLELLELIAQCEQPVDTLARETGLGITLVSSHLQILRRAGLVRTRREGTSILYRLSDAAVAALFVAMKRVAWDSVPELRRAVDDYATEGGSVGNDVPVAMLRDVDEPGVFVLDVRPGREFDAGHLPGATSIPLSELEQRVGELPADRRVIVYCRGEFCRLARTAARILRAGGIDAWSMNSGVIEWHADGGLSLKASA